MQGKICQQWIKDNDDLTCKSTSWQNETNWTCILSILQSGNHALVLKQFQGKRSVWTVCPHYTWSTLQDCRLVGDCLEGKRENYQGCSQFSAVLCATIVHSELHTHMNRTNSSLDWVLSHWAHFTVLRFIFVYVLFVPDCILHARVVL